MFGILSLAAVLLSPSVELVCKERGDWNLSDDERIVVVYDPTVAFDLGPVAKPTYVIDATTGKISVHSKSDSD